MKNKKSNYKLDINLGEVELQAAADALKTLRNNPTNKESKSKAVRAISSTALAQLANSELQAKAMGLAPADQTNPKALDPKISKIGKFPICSKALHPEFCYPLVTVSEMSIEKGYEPFNWLKPGHPVTMSYLIAAAQRHLDCLKMGIDINTKETTLDGSSTINQPHHAAQVAYNMLMLCLQIKYGVAIDDRQFKDGVLK